MSSVHAVTEDLKFEARIASFYELNDAAKEELLQRLLDVFQHVGKKHDFLVWRVQLVSEKRKD
jgi:tRNA/tmRNA/rRNA uracil-C5-methylase (TrmA/RlmC/RlmD family)